MVVNENFINQIKKVVPNERLMVQHSLPPKYLLPFVGENEIVFIYEQKIFEESTKFVEKTPFSDETLEELELTGQPLECPFNAEDSIISNTITSEKREEDEHCPITIHEARNIISYVNLKNLFKEPVYILTDNSDRNQTIVLGTARNEGWFTRSWITSDYSRDPKKITDVNEMIKTHHQLSNINPIHMESKVCSKFIILNTNECHSMFLNDSVNRLEINLSWKTPSFTIPLNETTVKMTIVGSISEENCEILELWEQLTLLYDYLEVIKTWKNDISTHVPYSRSRQCGDFPNIQRDKEQHNKSVKDALTQLLLEPNQVTGATLTGRNTDLERKPLEEIVRTIVNEKKEQEFTDRLWSLLSGCSSYQEVRSCFELVFHYVKNGSSKPYMKTSNITRLSHVLRCCKNDSSVSEMILEPLELLVEIGIEKLKKEYISVYLLANIATSEQLCIPSMPKFSDVKGEEWIENCSKWILWLMRVHLVLQLMMVTENIMKSNTCIIPLTALTLEHYLNKQSPISELVDPRSIETQTFITPINTRDIQELFNKRTQFDSWTLILKSEIANKKVMSIFHRNLDKLFPESVTLSSEFDRDCDDATFTSNLCPYHCYKFQSVSDLLF